MSHHEAISARLPHLSDPWPEGYRSLAQVLGPIEEVPFQGNLGPNDNPTVSHLGPIATPSIPVMVGWESTNQVMSANSNAGEKPPVWVTSSVSGTISSSGQVAAISQPTVVIPPTNTNVVPPPSSLGQPSGVQPINNPSSLGYTYPITQPPMVNQVYQKPPPVAIYPGITYHGNDFVP